MVVEKLAELDGFSFNDNRSFNSLIAKGRKDGCEIHCLLPQTYMNESGWAVRQYLDYYKITPAQLIVVCDDVALDFGFLRFRCQGSAGGHNGLKSIEAYLGTNSYKRLRMGVGSKGEKQTLADYVLSDFNAVEMAALDEFVLKGVAVLKENIPNML